MKYQPLDQVFQQTACRVLIDEPMARHCSFKIGGTVDRFVFVPTQTALTAILTCAKAQNLPLHLVGKGSNLLVPDGGLRGVVLLLCEEFSHIALEGDHTLVCGAGASLTSLCHFARDKGLSGLEFAYGIPGTAGGAAYMNAGAYGGEMQDVLVSCSHVTREGTPGELVGTDLALAYRQSAYTHCDHFITSLRLRLTKGDPLAITATMEELMQRRRSKQPLEYPSAGSTFKRPTGYFAAALIEECGLKGFSVGDAQVSEKHAGFVVNKGNATCAQVQAVIAKVQEEVYRQKGIRLECEVKLLSENAGKD